MKELTQVRDAVMTALDDAGLRTMAAFPAGRAKQYTDPVVTVAVGSAEGKNLGFCNYLGETYDETAGTVLELYGKQLSMPKLSRRELEAELGPMLAYYAKRDSGYILDRVCQCILTRQKLL